MDLLFRPWMEPLEQQSSCRCHLKYVAYPISSFASMKSLIGILFMVIFLPGSSAEHEFEPDRNMDHFGTFLQQLQLTHSVECSLVMFSDPQDFKYRKYESFLHGKKASPMDEILTYIKNTPSTSFDISENLTNILDNVQLNTITKCPLYLTIAPDIERSLEHFSVANKDWDKYFLSRKHVLYTESSPEDIEKFLMTSEINTMTRLLIVHPVKNFLQLSSNNPYKNPSDEVIQRLMIWRKGDLLDPKGQLFVDKLTDFSGYEMKVVTFHFPPRIFMIQKEEVEEEDYVLYGVDIDVVNALSEALNFSVVYSRPSDEEMWGWEQEDGNWTGLMGDLQNRRADIGVADLYIMENYFAIIDMSVEYDIEYLCFATMVPGPLPQWMALGLPFLIESWLAIFITILLGMVVFVIIARLGFAGNTQEIEASWFRSTSNVCLLLFASVMNTPWIRVPKVTHLRIFIALWSVAFIILAVSYKGTLVSYLTVPLEQPPIDTHKQLYEKDIDVGSIGYTLKRIMDKNADQFVRLLGKRYQHVPSTSVGLERTLSGRYSFLESRGFLDYTIAVDHTNRFGRASLHAMREYIAPFGIGLAFPKYVPYINKFNNVIRRLTEAGFAKKWMADIILRSKQAKIKERLAAEFDTSQEVASSEESSNIVQPLNLNNLQGGFILLGLGFLLGLAVFLIELLATKARGSYS